MARQVAFVMQLPPLSGDQEGLVRRYGQEHCEEMRITTQGANTQVSGLLIHPFSNKKVAQTSLGINLKSWKIKMPKYVRGWYRELSMDEYFAEFKEGPSLLGRRMHTLVSGLVSSLIQRGITTATKRVVRAMVKVKKINNNRQRAFQLLAAIVDRRQKQLFDILVEPLRQRRRERDAMYREDADARQIARDEAREQKHKAALEMEALMACPLYRKRLEQEKVEKEKEQQKRNVAYHVDRLKRKREDGQ
jgi:hypothetical protein